MSNKFESEDLPKILAALKRAHEAGQTSRVTVEFSADGGVISVLMESKQKFK